jgi:hypothetical protein
MNVPSFLHAYNSLWKDRYELVESVCVISAPITTPIIMPESRNINTHECYWVGKRVGLEKWGLGVWRFSEWSSDYELLFRRSWIFAFHNNRTQNQLGQAIRSSFRISTGPPNVLRSCGGFAKGKVPYVRPQSLRFTSFPIHYSLPSKHVTLYILAYRESHSISYK